MARDAQVRIARDAGVGAQGAPFTLGWLGEGLQILGKTRRFVYSPTPEAKITILGAMPVNLQVKTYEDLLTACRNVVLGSSTKAVASVVMPAGGGDLAQAATPANIRSFGLRAQIGDGLNSFKAGGYIVGLQDGATSFYQILVEAPPRTNCVELIMLSAQFNGGVASIVALSNPTLFVQGSLAGSPTIPLVTNVTLLTLNERDLGDLELNA